MWGWLAACAAVGYRRRCNAGGTLWIRPITNRPQLAKPPHKSACKDKRKAFY
jgi:hypothetical protein